MDSINQVVSGWSRSWVLVGHTIVCGACMASQAASDANLPFAHAHGCREGQSDIKYPWYELDRISHLVVSRSNVLHLPSRHGKGKLGRSPV